MSRGLKRRKKNQITNPKLKSNSNASKTHFVNPNRFAIQFYHVHDFDGIVGVLFSHELDKPVALVVLSYAVFGHVHVDNGARLHKQLP